MGLFDFMKDAGEDITAPVEVSPERLDELRTRSIAAKVAELDVEGEQVSVQVKGDNAVLTGTAPSQEALEKIVLCAGNQFGIATVDCQLRVDAPAAAGAAPAAAAGAGEATFYTVKSGDTLGKIAQQQYGSASKYTVIFEANQPMLKDPDKIYPGQSLRIPAL
ncbi:MAG: peptidoglycan-binding protein LysM [Halieaceae bacterium]|nr:peptidoglycan-binding protein LysM [Halieaceae bacterium]MCP5187904.1 peptidoglycan-binding protein LysM [Pseudomonadales bacterium]